MDELEKNIPDDFWRKAFNEAAETPPPRVWSSIEQQLDEANRPKVIPLWGSGLASSRPLLWGSRIAATLALLIVGWWAINTRSVQPSPIRIQASGPTENVARKPITPPNLTSPESTEQTTDVVASGSKPSGTSIPALAVPSPSLSDHSTGQLAQQSKRQARIQAASEMNQSGLQPATVLHTTSPAIPVTNMTLPTMNRMAVVAFAPDRNVAVEAAGSKQTNAVAYEQLRGKSLRLRSLGPIQRMVWFQPAELPMDAEFTKQKRKHAKNGHR